MSHNNNVYSIFKSRRKGRKANTSKLGYSNLEDRQLLASDVFASGSITLDPTTSVLEILGTNDVSDRVFISTQTENEVRVQFNGDFCIFDRADVTSILFTGLGGDDVFNNGLSDIPATAFGGAGNDRLIGGSVGDRLIGNTGDDLLIGNQGEDKLFGNDGEDTIQGSQGDDVAFGGFGDDNIRGGTGNDTLSGDFGDDFISGDVGNDTITGGSGDDQLQGLLGNDILIGNAGNDTIVGGEGNDRLFGSNGIDTIFGQNGDDTINGNADGDFLSGGNGIDTIQGSLGNDSIRGDAGNDILIGSDGDDVIIGNNGDDFIVGGNGDDTIQGNDGNDTIGGQSGNDVINGDGGNDTIFGGDGDDNIFGGSQNDSLFGQAGSDRVLGESGIDRVVGNEGNDFLSGGFGNDFVAGNAGDDQLFGDAGIDVLRGGDGNDGLFGGTTQNSRLFGEGGSDRFLTTGNEQIIDMGLRDVEVVFRNGSSNWTNAEIAVIDTGLQRMQLRIGNNQLAIDPIVADPIVFLKEATIPSSAASLSLSTLEEIITPTLNLDTGDVVNTVSLERQYVFADWNENNIAANELRSLEVPRAISIAWASTDAIETVVPDNNQTFDRFTRLSLWQTARGGEFFRISEDGTEFYRRDAAFADETGRINSTQDWASAWQLFFTPVAAEDPDTPIEPEPTPDNPFEIFLDGPANFLTGESVTIFTGLQSGFPQLLTNFGFTLDNPGTVNIFTGDATNGIQDTNFDTELYVFSLNADGTFGTLIGNDDDSGDGLDSMFTPTLPAGDYVLVLGDFPLTQEEAALGIGTTGDGGPFQITFEGTDGVVQLPFGPLDADPIEQEPGIDAGVVAKLDVLDQLFTSLENF